MTDTSVDARIDAAIAALDPDELANLAIELIAVPGPTGHEEAVARFLHRRMQEEGLYSRLQPFAPDRCNVLGVHEGSGGGRSLMFNGHLDSVWRPGDDESSEILPDPGARIDGDWMYGRGVANMRGPLASYVSALKAVRRAGVELAGDVLIAGVAGGYQSSPVGRFQGQVYRGFGVGTQHLLALGGVADMCVLGDPTSFKLWRRHFGWTHVRVDIETDRRDLNTNAIEQAADMIHALRAWVPDYQRRHAVDGTAPSVRIIAVEGGAPWTTDRLPSGCSIFLCVGTQPDDPSIGVKHELRRVIASLPQIQARVELYSTTPGASVPEDSPLVEAVCAAHANIMGTPLVEETLAYYFDAGHLNRYGIPTVNYGPGGRARPGESMWEEHLYIPDLVAATRVYIDLIVRVCGAG